MSTNDTERERMQTHLIQRCDTATRLITLTIIWPEGALPIEFGLLSLSTVPPGSAIITNPEVLEERLADQLMEVRV